VGVHGTGRCLFFSSKEPTKCLLDGKAIDFDYDNPSSRLVVTLPESKGLHHELVVVL
jgi:hypothetical protein